jgi:glutathionylspermidine synthase
MERIASKPRGNWEQLVESQGFCFHTMDGQPYWDESAFYRFTSAEVDEIERATYELDRMCLEAVEHVVASRRFGPFGIPDWFADYVAHSWEEDELTIYGRFDLAYGGAGSGPPKLLEYNADTPTSLLEASVIQWHWMQDLFPQADQFNGIHEKLIEAWQTVRPHVKDTVYFSSMRDVVEDFMTVNYVRDTAMQAGLATEYIAVEDLGWNDSRQLFLDLQERPIAHAFKLYPWEWLIREAFGPHLVKRTTRWLEAPWKMILSNKAILAVLWELFPESPFLLPASFQPVGNSFVKKPTLGREGANITMVVNGQTVQETEGVYGGPFVYEALHQLPDFGGNYPVVGSWMVNGNSCGMGIREDESAITTNASRFVPHLFEH